MCKLIAGYDAREQEFTIHDTETEDPSLIERQLVCVVELNKALRSEFDITDPKKMQPWPKGVLALDLFSPDPPIYLNGDKLNYVFLFPCGAGQEALVAADSPAQVVGSGGAEGKKAS